MRLVTRGDLDGLTCAILLHEVEAIDDIALAHPKDVQDGRVELSKNDILANLPYDERVGIWYDHHSSQQGEAERPGGFKGAYSIAPSAARVIADHYGADKFKRFEELLKETDRLDAAQLTPGDVINPQGWILLGLTLDPRSGLGGFREYFQKLVRLGREQPVEEILQEEEVAGRVKRLREEDEAFLAHLKETSKLEKNVIYMDVRGMKGLPAGNRFLVYTVFPEANVSMRVADGLAGKFISVQVGHSIFNRTCKTNVGDLMAKHGGGGHKGAGTCQPTMDKAEDAVKDILETLKANG